MKNGSARTIKCGVRVLGIASGVIKMSGGRHAHGKRCLLVGVVRRQIVIEGILSTSVAIDGGDATSQIIKLARDTRFRDQIKLIALNGIAIAGLNIIDINELEKRLGVQTIMITRSRPHKSKLMEAVRKGIREKAQLLEKESLISEVNSRIAIRKQGGLYIQAREGSQFPDSIISEAFETLRIAHLIARGISTGESKGRI
jgi:endonuclease V-like protein UPF0215 family